MLLNTHTHTTWSLEEVMWSVGQRKELNSVQMGKVDQYVLHLSSPPPTHLATTHTHINTLRNRCAQINRLIQFMHIFFCIF